MSGDEKAANKEIAMQQTMLQVDGMSCSSCVRHIQHALGELDGIDNVDVKLREGTVVVQHDAASAPLDTLVEALRDAGYESRLKAA